MKRLGQFFAKNKKETVLAVLLILLSVISFIVLKLAMPSGGYVEVKRDGVIIASYPLSVDGKYSLNGGTNVLVIENNEAYMYFADCPDGICIRTGRISHVAESIICLPNKLSVTVVSSNEGEAELTPGSP